MKYGMWAIGAGVLGFMLNSSVVADELLEVKESVTIAVPAEKIWGLIGDFNNLPKWHPAVAKSALETKDNKTYRIVTLKAPNDPTITEGLLGHDDAKMQYSYDISKVDPALLPVQNYTANITVHPTTEGKTTVSWEAHFMPVGKVTPEEAQKIVKGIFTSGLNNIDVVLKKDAK